MESKEKVYKELSKRYPIEKKDILWGMEEYNKLRFEEAIKEIEEIRDTSKGVDRHFAYTKAIEILKSMEYKGRLFGRIQNKYFDTGKTADDWDNSEYRIKELESLLESKANYVCDEHLVKRIKELEEKNNELKHINSLIKRDYEKKDKEIELLRREMEDKCKQAYNEGRIEGKQCI